MNIHVNEGEAAKLFKATIFSTEIGSHMYGTNNENSDKDILYIYAVSEAEQYSLIKTHHQYQFKKDGVDHIFVNVDAFFRNSLSGDSTINFEIINSLTFKESKQMSRFYHMRQYFANYKIVRSYLGMARRDLKHMNRDKDDRSRNKKLAHSVRGLKFARSIVSKEFNPIISGADLEYIKHIFSIDERQDRENLRESTDKDIDSLRLSVNQMLDDGTLGLPKYMEPGAQLLLDSHLYALKTSNFYKEKVTESLLFKSVYEANEEDIKY